MELRCADCDRFAAEDATLVRNQKKTEWVIWITFVAMVFEIAFGYVTGSMALTADGWHMASHVGALLIAVIAYRLARSRQLSRSFSFGAGKLIPLGGYTSAVALLIIAILVLVESASRIVNPVPIEFNEAIGVAVFGLLVNIVSAWILNADPSHAHHHGHGEHCEHGHHHHHHVHDHNIRSAFLHILADAVTSVLAIAALTVGKFYHVLWLDPLIGIFGSFVIFFWAFGLCRDTGWELLDGHAKTFDWKKLQAKIEAGGAKVVDFHVWRVAPRAIACELVVESKSARGFAHYREMLMKDFAIQHAVVEERVIP